MPTGRDVTNNLDTDLTDKSSIANRINAVVDIQTAAVRRLDAIRAVLQPEGPPDDQTIKAALNTALSRANLEIRLIQKILDPTTGGDFTIP